MLILPYSAVYAPLTEITVKRITPQIFVLGVCVRFVLCLCSDWFCAFNLRKGLYMREEF